MNIKLTEQTVSLVNNAALKKLIKNKYKFAAMLALSVVISIVLVIATTLSTQKSDEFVPEQIQGADYSMALQHYAGFDYTDAHIGVYFDWTESEIMLKDGAAQLKINARVNPVNLDDISILWYTSDENIATVDYTGLITATNPGTVDVYAVITRGDVSKTAKATLNIIQPVTGIFMPVTTTTLYMGSTGQLLEAIICPANSSNQTLIWESKDEKIATVDENGHVKPVGVGMTEITVTTQEGGFTSKCFVNVVNYSVKPESVTIQNEYKNDAYLKVGESINVIAAVMPTNAKDKTLRWISTDPTVATVTQTGKVRAVSEGETLITVATSNGKQDNLKLTVQPRDGKDPFDLEEDEAISGIPVTNGGVTYSPYSMTLQWMVKLQMGLNPPPKKNGATQYASEGEVAEYMNPASYCTGAYKYQFLDLSHANGISKDSLNSFLADKGILRGHAADFIEAANEYNVSEVYLVAHACLETGNGTSTLSTGVEVNGTTVYNMYGIGAYDNSAVYSGSQKAYKEGWTTVSAAIKGGASWISDYYINASSGRQNTLYKMLWNPENPGTHQYATDIQWATLQAVNIEKIFRMFPEAIKSYDVPVYSGMSAPVIDTN